MIKVSQAVSGEIVFDNLIDMLMRTAIEQAGAERGLLILPFEGEPRLEATAMTECGAIRVQLCDQPLATGVLPEAVLHYVLRTGESVILNDASTESPFAADPYIRQRQARSVLCLPLLAQAKLIGVLYLENSLAPRVFSPTRIAVLKLLASQAAIALENARLYRDLAEREAKIGRLVDANIVGIVIWDLEGRILEANDAFLRIVGYDRDDLVSGRLRWTDLTPPEWRERDRREWMHGSRRWGHCSLSRRNTSGRTAAVCRCSSAWRCFEEHGTQGVGFVLDLSERKRAEAREATIYARCKQSLRTRTGLRSMGQLTASIAHEVKQPITAAATYACGRLALAGRQAAEP